MAERKDNRGQEIMMVFGEEEKSQPDYQQCAVCKKLRKRLVKVRPLPKGFLDTLIGSKTRLVCQECVDKENRE